MASLRLLIIALAFLLLCIIALNVEVIRDFYAAQLLVYNADNIRRSVEEVCKGGKAFSIVLTVYVPEHGFILLDNLSIKAVYKGSLVYNVKVSYRSTVERIGRGYHVIRISRSWEEGELPVISLKY